MIAALVVAVAARSDFVFTRQVDSLYDATGRVLLGPNCPRTDFYGTYSCAFEWGTNVTVNYTIALAETMNASYSLDLDFKVDNLFNLTARCPVCGGHCRAEVLGIALKFRLPPCPIRAGMKEGLTSLELPAKIPPPFAVLNELTGAMSIVSPQRNVLDRLLLTISAVPSRSPRSSKTVPGTTEVFASHHGCVGKPYTTFAANTCTRPPHSAYTYRVACHTDGHTVTKYSDPDCKKPLQHWDSAAPGQGLEVAHTTAPGTCYNHGRASIHILCAV